MTEKKNTVYGVEKIERQEAGSTRGHLDVHPHFDIPIIEFFMGSGVASLSKVPFLSSHIQHGIRKGRKR